MSEIEQEEELQFYTSPIATPMATDKLQAKIFTLTKKVVKSKNIKRGVKEVVKAIRKGAKGICILAGDVSPVDVISHIPVFCETKEIPYIFIRSRFELGLASQTKKPTSVVLLMEPSDEKTLAKFQSIQQKVKLLNPYC